MNTYNPEGYPVQLGTRRSSDLKILLDLAALGMEDAKDLDHAAKHVSHVILANLFHVYAAQRRRFASQLGNLFLAQGGDRRPSGGILTGWVVPLKQLWVDVPGFLSSADDDVIRAYCERNERQLAKWYLRALELDLPADIQHILVDHLAAVNEAVKLLQEDWREVVEPRIR